MPIVDTAKTPKPTLNRFDNSTDPIASFYALFWTGVRQRFWMKDGERPKHRGLAGARAHVRKHLSEISFALERRPQQFKNSLRVIRTNISAAKLPIDSDDVEAIEKLLFQGALCEAHLHENHTDKLTERLCFMRLRKIQSRAWQSISYFNQKCSKKRCVVGLKSVRNKILELVELRAKVLREAEENLPGADEHGSGPHLSAFYRRRALNAKPNRLQTVLAEIEQHEGKPLPENWNLLLFGLRSFFFEADEPVEPRDVLKVNSRLRDYAHRGGLSMMLDVFNAYSYFRLVRGQKESVALEFAGRITSPQAEEDALIVAKTYLERFNRLFFRSQR